MFSENFRYSSSFVSESQEAEYSENQKDESKVSISKSQAMKELKNSIENLISKKNTPQMQTHFSSSLFSEKAIKQSRELVSLAQKEQISGVDQILSQLARKPNFSVIKQSEKPLKVPNTKNIAPKEKQGTEQVTGAKTGRARISFLGHMDKSKMMGSNTNPSDSKIEPCTSITTNRNHARSNGKYGGSGKARETKKRKGLASVGDSPKSRSKNKNNIASVNSDEMPSATRKEEPSLKEKVAVCRQTNKGHQSNTSGSNSSASKGGKDSSGRASSFIRKRGVNKEIGPSPVSASSKPPRAKSKKGEVTSFSNTMTARNKSSQKKQSILKKYSMITEAEEYYKCRGTPKLSFLSFQEPNFNKNSEVGTCSSVSKINDEPIGLFSSSAGEAILPRKLPLPKQIKGKGISVERHLRATKISKIPGIVRSSCKSDIEEEGRCSPVAEVEVENEEEEISNQVLLTSPKTQKGTLSTLPPTTAGESSTARFSLCLSPVESNKRSERSLQRFKEDLKRVKYEIMQRESSSIETEKFLAELKAQPKLCFLSSKYRMNAPLFF